MKNMDFFEKVDVGSLTTFNIPAKSDLFLEISQKEELHDLAAFLKDYSGEFFILGGGSNTVFVEDYKGVVVALRFTGWEVISESESEVIVKVQAGSNWHEFVMWCVENNYGGVENLALIPGNVGTAPVQNIGAYGVEVKDVIRLVEFFDFEKDEFVRIFNDDCKFGYRDSVFKGDLKNKGVISAVEFRLSKKGFHKLNLTYKPVVEALEKEGIVDPSLDDVAALIVKIRQSKLPDWKKIGTAGSFFKNPIVDGGKVEELRENYPDIPVYEFGNGYKLAAGWLIDKSGLKGYELGGIGVYEKQALVLVNLGNAKGEELEEMIGLVQNSVMEKFGVELEPEVNILG